MLDFMIGFIVFVVFISLVWVIFFGIVDFFKDSAAVTEAMNRAKQEQAKIDLMTPEEAKAYIARKKAYEEHIEHCRRNGMNPY